MAGVLFALIMTPLEPFVSSEVRIIDESEVFRVDPPPSPFPPRITGGGGTNNDIVLLY